ncbi:hypothetical protein [Brevundimonas sp.]|uniref:hypothetical protein n=1 Tax=Brevundimonas sp. TaxID=1871086 RepID=UPI00260E8749|nr:hypothetical protein [Brevundimonas sp.]
MARAVRVKLAELKTALLHGGRVDASAIVLKRPGASGVQISSLEWGAHLPPHFMSGKDADPPGQPPGISRGLGARDFEKLSLAARAALLSQVGQEPREIDSRRATKLEASGMISRLQDWPVVYAEDVLKAIAWACDEVGPDQGRTGESETEQQLAMRSGLQLVGVRIVSRYPNGDGLRLVNGRLPFSLRLIGCVVECPLLLSHCQLTTLDLSGSALRSVDATGLVASGSVHMRRAVVITPVQFSGASIKGVFNASQVIFAPFQHVPHQSAVDLENGMFNLSKSDIDSDVHLDDARIWGGVSLRGARFRRSLHLDRAYLSSPLACFEKWVCESLSPEVAASAPSRIWAKMDEQLAGRIFDEPALSELEVLKGETHRWDKLVSRTLDRLKARALMCSLRGDGLILGGSLFARGLIANGRVRMKYAQVEGSMRMRGSRIRSPQWLVRDLMPLMPGFNGGSIPDQAKRIFGRPDWQAERPTLALDLQKARCAGGLDLSSFANGAEDERATEIDGQVDLSLFQTDEDIDLQGAQFGSPRDGAWMMTAEGVRVGRDVKLQRCIGLSNCDLSNAKIGGDLKFGDLAVPVSESESNFRSCPSRAIDVRGILRLRGATVGGDALLTFDPRSGPCIEADLVKIGGRLDIYPQPGTRTRQPISRQEQRALAFGFFLGSRCRHRRTSKDEVARASGGEPDGSSATPVTPDPVGVRVCDDCGAIVESVEHWANPFIDLRNGSATVFGHVTAAWPAPGGLSLEGFAYRQAGDLLGPLSPEPHLRSDTQRRDLSIEAIRSRTIPQVGQWARLASLAAALFAALPLLLTHLAFVVGTGRGGVVIDAGLAFAVALMLTVIGYFTLLRWGVLLEAHRRQAQTRPRAVAYLKLLRKSTPRFRGAPREVRSMDPYVTAARALRESGRYISANEVEKERLRLRASNLSWTLHWPGKATMLLTDWVVGFGFSLARGVGILASVVVMTAAFANAQFHADGFCVATEGRPSLPTAEDGAPGFIYALDVVLPFVNFEEADRWTPCAGAGAVPAVGFTAPLESGWNFATRSWPALASILGFALSTLIGLGAGARIESALAEVKE